MVSKTAPYIRTCWKINQKWRPIPSAYKLCFQQMRSKSYIICGIMSTSKPIYRRRQWHPTPVLLPGKSHGWMSLVGCSLWGREELDTTERLHFHFSLSCIGEGNGNPLQCSCLENPRDGGAWWATVYGVAQSRTRPKRLSSSSKPIYEWQCNLANWGN